MTRLPPALRNDVKQRDQCLVNLHTAIYALKVNQNLVYLFQHFASLLEFQIGNLLVLPVLQNLLPDLEDKVIESCSLFNFMHRRECVSHVVVGFGDGVVLRPPRLAFNVDILA